MKIKNWFSRKSKVALKNPATTTRLYDLYGETKDLDALRAKVNEIENLVNNLPPLPDLSGYYTKAEIDAKPYAKTNIKNTFTTSQLINGHLESQGLYKDGSSQNIAQIKNQGEKTATFLFEQPNAGFRNYCNVNIAHKYSNTNPTTLFSLTTKNTSEGIFLTCENNKLSFTQDTTIDNVAIPTADTQAANKKYVDDKVANIPSVDLSHVVKTNESANLEAPLYFFGNDQGTVGFAGRAQYSNASYEPTDGNEFVPKSYVDSRIINPQTMWFKTKQVFVRGSIVFRHSEINTSTIYSVMVTSVGGNYKIYNKITVTIENNVMRIVGDELSEDQEFFIYFRKEGTR